MRQKRVPILPLTDKEIKRFWSKIDKSGECWLWQSDVNQGGYGLFRTYRNKVTCSMLAHRVAWCLTYGAEPHENLVMRHQCHTPPCCNPTHLLTGTHLDNHHDMVEAGRKPANGWALGITGVAHPACRYSQEQRDRAIELMFGSPPMLLQDIAQLLGCNKKTIGRWRADYLGSKSYSWCRPKDNTPAP